jgi:hypothetical protein
MPPIWDYVVERLTSAAPERIPASVLEQLAHQPQRRSGAAAALRQHGY